MSYPLLLQPTDPSQSASEPPPYAYVFRNILPTPPLTKLDRGEELSEFHAMYWGNSIDEDEAAWVQEHGQLVENDGSDVIQGCFALELQTDMPMASKLWVRKDYRRIYDHCHSHCESVRTAPNKMFRPPIAIITGQPGIGKTQWIFYAVRRRLGESQPFLWYCENQWFLFVQAGVFKFSGDLRPSLFAPFMWAFVDANDCPRHYPDVIAVGHTRLFTIYTTSPRRETWEPLMKTKHGTCIIMNPWSWEEISQAADIYEFTGTQRTRAQEVFLEYGPTPRLCIEFVQNPPELERHHSCREDEIDKLDLNSLLLTVRLGKDLKMDGSHTIILVKRNNADNLYKFTIEPITLSVSRLLKRQLMDKEKKERLCTYLQTSKTEAPRIVAGLAFEVLAQYQLQEDSVEPDPDPYQTCSQTKRVSEKRKAEDVPPHDPHQRGVIASSSKASKRGQLKARKAKG